METKKKIIIGVVLVIVLALPILIDALSNSILKTIEYADLTQTRSNTSNYGFSLVYVAPESDENIKEDKQTIKDIAENYKDATNSALDIYFMDYDKLSSTERTNLLGDSTSKTAYMFLVNGETLKIITEKLDQEDINTYIAFYSNNMNGSDIPEDMKYFNVAESAKAFQTAVKRKNTITMAVFGRDSCFYCNQFKLVYNTVAEEYDLEDIYYFDSDGYDETQYEKVMDLGLKIPASCSKTKEEIDLQTGFDTPLTLFTKNGKVIDCISGYSNKSTLVTKLKTIGMIGA